MAEHARLLIEGIETKNIPEAKRDEAFRQWGVLVDFSIINVNQLK